MADAFSVFNMPLPMTDPTTGDALTYSVYRLQGVNGGMPISIGGLVMALCLARASELEAGIIDLMDTMEQTTEQLERLTEIEKKLIADEGLTDADKTFLTGLGITVSGDTDALITDIESKMDSLNSFSQETMIDLQSQTNKRDQAYDMVANILKSFNTVLVGMANNL